MPKIRAATVPEHREAQRRAILVAAREMILGEGLEALKFGALADRTGLARPSIYEYFRTKSELVVALVAEEAPLWKADVSAAMTSAETSEEALASFVRAILELVRRGRHELAFALSGARLDDPAQEAVAKAHEALFILVVPALQDLGVREVELVAELVGGVIMTAGGMLRRDRKKRSVVDAAVVFAVGAAKASATSRRRPSRERVRR